MKNEKKISEIFGRNPVMEALETENVDKVYLQNNVRGPYEVDLRQKCRAKNVPLLRVPEHKLKKFRNRNHQGVMALISPIKFLELDTVLPWIYEQGRDPFILVLDGITDVRNFGAITRSALAFGVDAVVISSKKSAAVNYDAVKSSAGALLQIPVCRANSAIQAVEFLKSQGLPVYGSSLAAKSKLEDIKMSGPKVIVMGSEDLGISREIQKLCDQLFIIPQSDKMESLNVSVASGIILYHCYVNAID